MSALMCSFRIYAYCYESRDVSLESSSLSLGGESIRKFDFWIGVFLSESSGSIRIYPKKSGTSGLLHHSNAALLHMHMRSREQKVQSAYMGAFVGGGNFP